MGFRCEILYAWVAIPHPCMMPSIDAYFCALQLQYDVRKSSAAYRLQETSSLQGDEADSPRLARDVDVTAVAGAQHEAVKATDDAGEVLMPKSSVKPGQEPPEEDHLASNVDAIVTCLARLQYAAMFGKRSPRPGSARRDVAAGRRRTPCICPSAQPRFVHR